MYGEHKTSKKYNNNQIEMNIYYKKLYEKKVFPYFLTQNFFDYFYYHAYGMGNIITETRAYIQIDTHIHKLRIELMLL